MSSAVFLDISPAIWYNIFIKDHAHGGAVMFFTDYAARIQKRGLNTYFVAQADREYHVRLQTVIPANPCCNCYSIAKAFIVTAIGILVDKKLLTPQTRALDVLGSFAPSGMDPKWKDVTVHDLLLHRVGFDRGLLDIDVDDASQYRTNDYLNLVLSTPLAHQPGTVSQYTDAAYYVLSRIIAQVNGSDVADLLRPILMDTMEFKEFAWSRCPLGYSMGATGLYLRTEDLVKLGVLYLNNGEWKGTRIISSDWVNTVLENGYEFRDKGCGWFGKGGMRGQLLIFNPSQGIAVGCHSYERTSPLSALIDPEP